MDSAAIDIPLDLKDPIECFTFDFEHDRFAVGSQANVVISQVSQQRELP